MIQELEILIKESEKLKLKLDELDTQKAHISEEYDNTNKNLIDKIRLHYKNEIPSLNEIREETQRKINIAEEICSYKNHDINTALKLHKEYMKIDEKSLSTIISLDKTAYDNGVYKTQDQWIAAGKDFASVADYYKAFKEIKNAIENGNAEDKKYATKLMNDLRNEWNKRWSVTSTRIQYGKDLEGTITQHHGSKDKDKIKETLIEIPVYEGVQIEKVLKDKGLKFMQSLLDTEDDDKIIMDTIRYVSGQDINSLHVYTLNKDSRKENKERPVLLGYLKGDFSIIGNVSLDDGGCARGGA